jgi:hypothetical protein
VKFSQATILYTCIWNLLDYSAAVSPVTEAYLTINVKHVSHNPRNIDNKNISETRAIPLQSQMFASQVSTMCILNPIKNAGFKKQ